MLTQADHKARYSLSKYCSLRGEFQRGFGGEVVRSVAFHLKGSGFESQEGFDSNAVHFPHVKSTSQRSAVRFHTGLINKRPDLVLTNLKDRVHARSG